MNNLTDRERAIFAALSGGPMNTSSLMLVTGDSKRQAVVQCIKYLGAKVAAEGWYIERTSPVGRGHIGTYELRRI